ncbi:MAG: SUMF1/EgtB/PvdO family nonheme iron enzyme [Terriglobales bacterium]
MPRTPSHRLLEPQVAGLVAEYQGGCQRSDALFQCIAPRALTSRPIPERHRLIFYLGHLEAFDWNLLAIYTLGWHPFRPDFDRLFAFGIDPPPGELPADRPGDWPAREVIDDYRRGVRGRLVEALETLPAAALAAAIEHRLMHLETLTYLLHQIAPEDKQISADAPVAAGPMRSEWIQIPSGEAWLGRDRQEPGYGWDNEFERHAVAVPEFEIGRYKISNGQYLAFVRAGGPRPPFWRGGEEEGWRLLAMGGEIPLPLDRPVYVTHEQAGAYAEWRGARLPSETEWQRAADGPAAPGEPSPPFPWGEAWPHPRHGNFGFQRWDPAPVTAYPDGDSGCGARQMVGNGWEWTASIFAPFPGFQPDEFYPGYSRNFFDGRHFVLKGGGPSTAARLLRRSFRNWYRPAYPYVHATIRLARS